MSTLHGFIPNTEEFDDVVLSKFVGTIGMVP